MKKLLTLMLIFASLNTFATNYFVSISGNNANNGLTAATPFKTTTFAATRNLLPGDTVFVKNGVYGNENVVMTKSGTKAKRIVFKGYRNNPREVILPIVDFDANYSGFTGFNYNTMPTFDGVSRAQGTAFKVDGCNYITVMNFQVQNYAVGFSAGTVGSTSNNYIYFENCNVYRIGNPNLPYSGKGFQLGDFQENKYSKNSHIYNSLAINCCAEGIEVSGDSNQVMSSRVYSGENYTVNASTNYYIAVFGNYNTIQSCRATRVKGLSHIGYGIVVRSNVTDNVNQSTVQTNNSMFNNIRFCTVDMMGESFAVKHVGTKENRFYKCLVYGSNDWNTRVQQEENSAIVFKDGARGNTFEALLAQNCTNGVTYSYSDLYDLTIVNSQNRVVNSEFSSCWNAVNFMAGQVVLNAGNNSLTNNTFRDAKNLFLCGRPANSSMSYINNIFVSKGGILADGIYVNTVINNQFTTTDIFGVILPDAFLAGTNHCITVDPLFLSPNDSHLQSISPCKRSGSCGFTAVDFDNQIRTSPCSMGCFR